MSCHVFVTNKKQNANKCKTNYIMWMKHDYPENWPQKKNLLKFHEKWRKSVFTLAQKNSYSSLRVNYWYTVIIYTHYMHNARSFIVVTLFCLAIFLIPRLIRYMTSCLPYLSHRNIIRVTQVKSRHSIHIVSRKFILTRNI